MLKDFFLLIRPYSLIDVLVVFLLARTLTIGVTDFRNTELFFGISYILLWAFHTLALEAKHKHPYRVSVSYTVPYALLIFVVVISTIFSPRSLIFVIFTLIFSNFYFKKEESNFFGSTSFIWRGLLATSLFLYGVSLYVPFSEMSLLTVGVSTALLFLYASRNLIGDIRDIAFDKRTFSVRFGAKVSYIVSFILVIGASLLLFRIFSNFVLLLPIILFAAILLFYDNGFILHKCAIIVTTFIGINIASMVASASLLYSNVLFLSTLSVILFYEAVPRRSNPKFTVSSRVRFLFSR